MKKPKKILILGSGALKIGQAGEFDYSGSQAIKAYKEEGIKTVLINPNIATIQTSKFLADQVYFLPINEYFVEEIIKKEKPDAVTLSFGGQTALNCGMNLYKKRVFKKYNVVVLGTSIDSIDIAEDRQKFADHLHKIDVSTPISKAAYSLQEAEKIVKELGLPVMIRAAFTLGGQKSGIAKTAQEFKEIVTSALVFSPQVLIEQYLHHYKEIEYEIVRDAFDNCVTICNMENMDPLGIHTGESIVVAPSQTLNNYEYQALRDIAIKIVRSLNIVGECNVQYALNPHPKIGELDYYVIELNPRLSRSSALASKATGYPLAYVAAKLPLGYSLMDIKNQVTRVTQSFFEPALDYVVVKIPRWDLEKFNNVEEIIGSSMKSVGEVMGIGRTFEEALQKAIRMLDIGAQGITQNSFPREKNKFLYYLKTPTPKRFFAVAEALKRNISIKRLYKLTGIDLWFLYRIKNIVTIEADLKKAKQLDSPSLLKAKQLGISDNQLGILTNQTELDIRELRKKFSITPSVFQIDTLAGEFPAQTNYLYMTYNGNHNDVEALKMKGVMVLGSGPYRIGSSVEFDWTCVNTALALKKHNKKSIIINCNPETVSTDYDISDRLYFEELSFERVSDIYEFENSSGIIVSVGGQTPNNLARPLSLYGAQILGTSPTDIDRAEDRKKFSKLLDTLSIPQPEWDTFSTVKGALRFSKRVGFPVLIRPSYVLSGSAMNVCYDDRELKRFLKKAVRVGKDHPIIVSKFMVNSREIECDAVAQNGKIKAIALSEHIENAGVHSGDATICFPTQKVYVKTDKRIREIAIKLAEALHISGPFNIQFLARDNNVFVIETNVRASRTFPFISKATGINLAHLIVDGIYGKAEKKLIPYPDFVLVKAPQFSFSRLEGADPVLRVEMASTGEVACFGDTLEEAYLKAIASTGVAINKKTALLSIGGIVHKKKFLESVEQLESLEFKLFATGKTHEFLMRQKIATKFVYKVYENKNPNVVEVINNKEVGLVINTSDTTEGEGRSFTSELSDGYRIRRAAIDNNIPLFTDLHNAILFIRALTLYKEKNLKIEPWNFYI